MTEKMAKMAIEAKLHVSNELRKEIEDLIPSAFPAGSTHTFSNPRYKHRGMKGFKLRVVEPRCRESIRVTFLEGKHKGKDFYVTADEIGFLIL